MYNFQRREDTKIVFSFSKWLEKKGKLWIPYSFFVGHVMTSSELDHHLLCQINPLINVNDCHRVRGEELAMLKRKIDEFQNACTSPVIDVCMVYEGRDEDLRKTPTSRRRGCCLSRFLNVLTREVVRKLFFFAFFVLFPSSRIFIWNLEKH